MNADPRYHPAQSLNAWHAMFYDIYGIRNSERDEYKLFAHLVEVAGGLSKMLRREPRSPSVGSFLGKLLAWYCALARRLGYTDLEGLAWQKYPHACPYCGQSHCKCSGKRSVPVLRGNALRELQMHNRHQRPDRLDAWAQMFLEIYGEQGSLVRSFDAPPIIDNTQMLLLLALNRLAEELGELSEAIRLEHVYPIALTSELADVFAWIMAVVNIVPRHLEDPGFSLEGVLWKQYPAECTYCFRSKCICPNERVRSSLVQSAGDDLLVVLDPLTGLPRKDRFERRLAESVAKATASSPLTLMIIDLDHFKNVNDRWGHGFGDSVLKGVSEIFQKIAAANSAEAFRWGGEEFSILLSDRSQEEAIAIANRIREDVKAHLFQAPNGEGHSQTVSIGIATTSSTQLSSPSLISRTLFDTADRAVYESKSQGRNKTTAIVLDFERGHVNG